MTVTIERLDPRDYRSMPWKNGGGVSVDIASERGAGGGDWDALTWRFGRTRIERPGPFSDLAGYDRCLSLVEGSGLVLKPAGAPPIDVRQPFRPVRFAGELRIESELEAGGVGVLNLMTERRRATGELRFPAVGEEVVLNAGIAIFYAPAGSATLSLGDKRFELARDEALLARSTGPLAMRHDAGTLALAGITPRA